MEPEQIERQTLPAWAVGLATALSGIPVSLLLAALYMPPLYPEDPHGMMIAAQIVALAGCGPSCLIGAPIALLLLRNPNRSVLSWAACGAATALISVAIVGFWILGIAFPLLLLSFAGPMLVMGAGTVIGAISGLIARGLLALFFWMSDTGRR